MMLTPVTPPSNIEFGTSTQARAYAAIDAPMVIKKKLVL